MAANNIFAFNVTTGKRVATFNHSLNAQGLFVTASPDGARVYVAGDFTTVDGLHRGHVAAFNTSDGSLVSSFAPSLSALGGCDRGLADDGVRRRQLQLGGRSRSHASRGVQPRERRVAVVGAECRQRQGRGHGDGAGQFPSHRGGHVHHPERPVGERDGLPGRNLGGQPAVGGEPDHPRRRHGSSITALRSDGKQIYGSGFAYHTGRFEGSFAANPLTGAIIWANDCHGDTYDVFPVGQDLYTVSHAHDCSWIGSFPESKPRSVNARHALAFTTYPTTTNKGPDNYGWNYNGVPASSLLHWFPVVTPGTYTGQNQAAWSVYGNSNYVVLGGEFPRVNGIAQQGLTRFAVASLAPNKRRPVLASGATTSATAAGAGTVQVAWRAAYDMDNTTLRYDVFRSGTTNPVFTRPWTPTTGPRRR